MPLTPHELALRRFQKGKDALNEFHQLAIEDKEFKCGKQWPSEIKAEREATGRPCLTLNTIPVFTDQISNSNAMNKPRIRVVPNGNGADEETAKVLNGIIRHIQNNSNAKNAYNTAFSDTVDTGLGGFTMDVDYIKEDSMKQDVFINRIRNNLAIIPDPSAQKLDYSDREWQFVEYSYDKDAFQEEYPDREITCLDTENSFQTSWYGEQVRVAEYYYKEYTPDTLYLLADGNAIYKSVYDKQIEEILEKEPEFIPPEIVDQRPTKRKKVKWALMDGAGFIEEADLLWCDIPVVIMLGEEDDIAGKQHLQGKVRRLKDPQQELNFWSSAETEGVALMPKPKWVAAKGSFKSNQREWDESNTNLKSTLEYDIVEGPDGQVMPAPQFVTFNSVPMGADRLSSKSVDTIKFLSGVSDPSLGLLSQERSGVAVKALQSKTDVGTYEYTEHQIVALEYAGRLLVDIIPKIWDTPDEIVRIMEEDGTITKQQINKTNVRRDANGMPVESPYQLNQGTYDVVIEVGADFHTKREQNREYLIEFAKAFPGFAETFPDLVAKDMDFNSAQEMVERIQYVLEQKYPGMIKSKDGKINPAQFMALVQKSQKMQQAIQELSAQLNDQAAERQTKMVIANADNQTKLAVAQINAGNKVETTVIKANADLQEKIIQEESEMNKLVYHTQQKVPDL